MPIRFSSTMELIPGMHSEPVYLAEWLIIQAFVLRPEAIRVYF